MRLYGLPRNHAPCFNTTKGLGPEDAPHVCRTDIQGQATGESFKDEEHRKRGLAFLDQADDAILRSFPSAERRGDRRLAEGDLFRTKKRPLIHGIQLSRDAAWSTHRALPITSQQDSKHHRSMPRWSVSGWWLPAPCCLGWHAVGTGQCRSLLPLRKCANSSLSDTLIFYLGSAADDALRAGRELDNYTSIWIMKKQLLVAAALVSTAHGFNLAPPTCALRGAATRTSQLACMAVNYDKTKEGDYPHPHDDDYKVMPSNA